jgi:hypothetical protein
MSSESTPGTALDRRDRVARAIYDKGAYCGDCEYDGWDSCSACRRVNRGYADVALAAVLPALADEISQNHELFRPEGSAVAGWLRSLAAPADDQEAQRP